MSEELTNLKLVSRTELNAWLTREIRKEEDCGDSTLEVQYLLAEADTNGCNWSGLVAKPGKNTSAEQISPIAAEIGKRASSLFNLTE